MENKDDDHQDLLPVEIETNQSYLLNYEKNNTKEDIAIILLSFLIIFAHLLNSLFNTGININYAQEIGIPSSNFNNITTSYEIENIKPSNLFLMIGFLFSKNKISKDSYAYINLTSLIEASYNTQKAFEKGIHMQNLVLYSGKDRISSNFSQFFITNQINFDSLNLTFSIKGFFDDFSKCVVEIFYASSMFTYFYIFTCIVSTILILVLLLFYTVKTLKIKGSHPFRPESYFAIFLLSFSLLYIISNISILQKKNIFYYIRLISNSLSTSGYFASVIFFRNLNYPFNLKKNFLFSIIIFIIYFSIDFSYSLEVKPILYTVSYVLRIIFSMISLFTIVKYEKASLKEYGNNLLFSSGFILLFGFVFNNEKLILIFQKYYNYYANNILFSQTLLMYSLVITYIFFPAPLETVHVNDHQPSKQLTTYVDEKQQISQQ